MKSQFQMNVLIILGHPRKDSFSAALAAAYGEGARLAKMNVRELVLADLNFNPNVVTVSPRNQKSEGDISHAQALISWADHLVFVYPTWWGTMPALLKGFLDRAFAPGFAFEEIEVGKRWKKLLTGKSGQLITTMDTPLWVYRWIYRTPGHNAMGKATLKFCGINPVRTLSFSPINNTTPAQRLEWLNTAKREGLKLHRGIFTQWEKFWNKTFIWLRAVRLQFYPMTWIAYAAGAYGAVSNGIEFNRNIFWIGYLWLFLVEVATVLSNDYFDFDTDQQNKSAGLFTGGSRVIVDKLLSFKEMRKGIFIVLLLSVFVAAYLIMNTAGTVSEVLLLLVLLFILALGYTVPPLKLSYRGLGEIDVGLTHSLGVILCGYVFQGGGLNELYPWLLSVPLFLGILPSIVLAGIPDFEADKAVGKRTIAVKSGKKGAAVVAIVFTILSALAAVVWVQMNIVSEAYGNAIYLIIPHAVILIFLLLGYLKDTAPSMKIDKLMIASLTYVLWFAVIPLLKLI